MFTSSAGCTVCGSVQYSVSCAPAAAAAIRAAPNGNGTRTESPLPPELEGKQFGPTTKVGGKVVPPAQSAKYVWPCDTNGISVTFATPIRIALAPAALIESTIQTLTNVGRAAAIAWTCVRPPRNSCVRALELVPGVGPLCRMSMTSAEGTATLLR